MTRPTRIGVRLWPAYAATFLLALGQWAARIAVPLQVQQLGGSLADAGLIAALRFGLVAVLALPFGAVADVWGIRRILLVGVVGNAAVNLVPILAVATGSQLPLYGWAVLSGLTGSLVGPAVGAYVVGAAPEASRGSAFGWLTFAAHTGAALGPAVGGLVWDGLGPAQTYLVASGVASAALVGPVLIRASVRTRAQLRELPAMVRAVARDRVIVGSWVASMSIGLPWGAVAGLFPLFGTSVGLSAAAIGLLMAVQSVANGLSRIPLGRLIDRHRIPPVMAAAGGLAYAACVAVLGPQHAPLAIGAVLVVSVLAIAFTLMLIQLVISERAPEELRATALGGYSTTLSAALGVGPILAGGVGTAAGFTAGFGLVALGGGLVALVAAVMLAGGQRAPAKRSSVA